mgnify:CR=1 FL=1
MTMAGSTVDVGNLVGADLIEKGDAEISELEPRAIKTSAKSKKTKKAEN